MGRIRFGLSDHVGKCPECGKVMEIKDVPLYPETIIKRCSKCDTPFRVTTKVEVKLEFLS